jgi:hypothetical protein
MTYQVDIIDPKAKKLLQNLADMKLISIKQDKRQDFLTLVASIRKKAKTNPPSFDEITKEVEIVRAKRYASKKK